MSQQLVRASLWLIAASAFAQQAQPAPEKLDQARLLQRIIDVQRLAAPMKGEATLFFSSDDPAQSDGDWRVLANVTGNGIVTRIFATADDKKQFGEIRIEVDGAPAINAPLADLFRGKVDPITAPLTILATGDTIGWTIFPIGFSKSVRILQRGAAIGFQVHVVTLANPPVEPFTTTLTEPATKMRDRVAAALRDGMSEAEIFAGRRASPFSEQRDVAPREKFDYDVPGGGTIRAFYIALSDRAAEKDLYALHHCVLRIYFDGATEPAVESPLIDFFASGFDWSRFNALTIGTDRELNIPLDRPPGDDRYFYSGFPMPFRNGAKIQIENRNENKIALLLYMRVDTSAPAENSLRFHARYRCVNPAKGESFPVLKTDRAGRLVGFLINVDSPRDAEWIRGTLSIRRDGAEATTNIPLRNALFATPGVPKIAPRALGGVTRGGAFGKGSGYILFIDDAIPFTSGIDVALKLAAPPLPDTYLGTLAYWYSEPGATAQIPSLKPDQLRLPGLRIPNAVEIEGRVKGPQTAPDHTGWGNNVNQKSTGAELSGEEGVAITTADAVPVIITVGEQRTVKLKLRVHPHRPFETIEVADASGNPIGTVKYARAPNGIYDVGTLTLQPGENLVTVKCSKPAVLDCWILD